MNRTWQKISFFGLLYFIQGAVFAYAVNFQKPYLTGRGLDKTSVGFFTSLLLVPFICKIFLGMLSDRVPIGRFGSRKPYMLIGLALFALCYTLLSSVDPSKQFIQFAGLSFAASIGLALFDTCCDGWAIDVARSDEQGAIQAGMVGGRSLGLIAASLLFGIAAELHGFELIFQLLAIMAAGVWLVVLVLPYVPLGDGQMERPHKRIQWSEFRELLAPVYLVFALYGVLYSISSFGTDGLLALHLADTRLSNAMDLGLFGTCRGVGALMGAWMFASYVKRVAKLNLMRWSLIGLGVGCLLPLANLPVQYLGAFWGLAWGFQETAFVTLAMVFARGHWAATFFAIFMIFSNVGTAAGEAIGGAVAQTAGYGVVFSGFAVLAWLMAFTMPRYLTQKL